MVETSVSDGFPFSWEGGKACGQKMVVKSSSGEEGKVARLQVSI